MSELNDLQQLWQGQSAGHSIPEPEQTLSGIQEFHRKVRRERRWLTLSFIFTFLFLTATFWMYHSTLYVIGILTVFGAMTFMLVLIWKNRLQMDGSQFDLSNQQFLSSNIDFIQRRRALTARYMPVYGFLLILGINVGYIDILGLMDLPSLVRIGIHMGLSLVMILFFRVGIKKHLKKFDLKLTPLLTSLKKMNTEEKAE